jgi:hypothetical protein
MTQQEREHLAADLVALVRGILNGTTKLARCDQPWDSTWSNVTFRAAGGDVLTFFNDAAELDYLDSCVLADGRAWQFGDNHEESWIEPIDKFTLAERETLYGILSAVPADYIPPPPPPPIPFTPEEEAALNEARQMVNRLYTGSVELRVEELTVPRPLFNAVRDALERTLPFLFVKDGETREHVLFKGVALLPDDIASHPEHAKEQP